MTCNTTMITVKKLLVHTNYHTMNFNQKAEMLPSTCCNIIDEMLCGKLTPTLKFKPLGLGLHTARMSLTTASVDSGHTSQRSRA